MKQVSLLTYEFRKNNSGYESSRVYEGTELIKQTKKVMVATYDFTKLGGAIGSVSLLDPNGNVAFMPMGSVITKVWLDVSIAPTSGGSATIAATSQTAGDLLAATAIASVTGLVDGVPNNTATRAIKLTADNTPQVVIAVAALTAGKFNVIIEYVVSL